MLLNPICHQRLKHFDLLLAKELTIIEREHFYNIVSHRKLENTIRQDSTKTSINERRNVSIPFDDIFNERTGTIDCHRYQVFQRHTGQQQNSHSTVNNRFERCRSSNVGKYHNEDLLAKSKVPRLPAIIKASLNVRERRDSKNMHWMTTLEQIHRKKPKDPEVFAIWNDDATMKSEPKRTVIQQQVRTFLNTLPIYQGVHKGFDSFGVNSLHSDLESSIVH